jgi:protoheme ferro-lyase
MPATLKPVSNPLPARPSARLDAGSIAARRALESVEPAPLRERDGYEAAARADLLRRAEARTSPSTLPSSLGGGVTVVDGPARVSAAGDSQPRKVGVLLTSHGDINDVKTELRGYVREAVLRNPGLPLPKWVRPAVDAAGWPLQKDNLLSQYAATGPTRYKENTELQAAAVTEALKKKGVDAKTYYGFNFMAPFIDDAIAKMKADGITDIVIFNQGAQNSVATMGESVMETEAALKARPDYKPEVKAVLSYNDDPRFERLLGDRIIEDAKKAFPGSKPEDTLILMTSHGLPLRMVEQGDNATKEMMELYGKVKARLEKEGYQVEHGYLNDDFFPGAEWTSPKAKVVAEKLVEDVIYNRREAPKNVLLDGRLSFTIHHRATLFDANTEVRDILTEPSGPAWSRFKGTQVALAPNFDGDPRFGELIADLAVEALAGKAPETVTVLDGNGDGK